LSGYPPSKKEVYRKRYGHKALVTQTNYILDLDYYNGNVLAIDIQLDTIDVVMDSGEDLGVSPADHNYVILLPGSTGQPSDDKPSIPGRLFLWHVHAQV